MSETTASFWTLPEPTPASHLAAARIRRRFPAPARGPLSRAARSTFAALCVGACIGAAATALATLSVEPAPAAAEPVYRAPGRSLDLEWRSYRTPVDVDRMFRADRRR